ncbi:MULTISPECIES: hypothetical protein [Paenibacillus]|uniref:hypothetical protein n=1 Tax=Paenibacillus TaxID=44249 RepID=UPI00096F666C|nr:hypothetical protein [Paenibacillus odorifer]OMC98464.1 hypothetical protein BJP49_08505 [Paenibacillus odorifer]OMD07312.1 hypothetical protein BJP47_11040 [Paenibacillus odorifer]OMD20148.1 hypothetical protein BJP48_10495 [Paenibacillus odorifer]OME29721.1 hypothetical protein BSK63_19950 [Paenibacillus odorifer]OME35404.1 hypothetical protein BSK46_19005 [Paenibacillus odorifer]
MSELLEMRLEVVPGLVKAAWTTSPGRVTGGSRAKGEWNVGTSAVPQGQRPERPLSLKVPVWHAARRKEILRRLALSPDEVFALLQGRLTGGLAELDLLPTDTELEQALFEGEGLEDQAETLQLIKERLAEEPLLALSLRGFTKGELLDGIFALWAESDIAADDSETEAAPVSELATELARLERKGPAISSGEWLAEAAAEGSLHQPGPQFHEITARPFPSSPVVAAVTEDWGALLPQTPKALEGLTLIMNRVAEAAARRASKA